MDPTQEPDSNLHTPVAPTSQSDQVGTPMKSYTGWQAKILIIILLAVCGVFIILGGYLFLPIIIPLVIWYVWMLRKQQSAVRAFAVAHGYTYQPNTILEDLDGVLFQTPDNIMGQGTGPSKGYLLSWLIHGQLNGRAFRMYEYGIDGPTYNTGFDGIGVSKSQNQETVDFDVIDIAVNGEALQFLLISKTHQSQLNQIHINLKSYQLEGNFNDYFTLYGADGAEIEIFRIFTPDVMAYLIDHYQDYSLELTPQHFYLYRGNASLSQAGANCESLIVATSDLSAKLFTGIEKVHYASNVIVPAAVQVPSNRSRVVIGFTLSNAIFATFAISAFAAGLIYLINTDNKIPAGYIQATNAEVIKDTPSNCQSTSASSDSCNDSYTVTAKYTAQNGKVYQYSDSLLESHDLGSSINLYYNPSDPVRADFVGQHTSPIAVPLIIGFFSCCILFVWTAYFMSKRK